MTVSPPDTSVRNRPMPTTAGISSAPARMAVWLVGPPLSVAKARTVRGEKSAVSDGIRSFASRMTGSVRLPSGLVGWPSSAARTCCSRSTNSVGLAPGGGAGARGCGRAAVFEPLDVVADDAADGVLGGVPFRPDALLELPADVVGERLAGRPRCCRCRCRAWRSCARGRRGPRPRPRRGRGGAGRPRRRLGRVEPFGGR